MATGDPYSGQISISAKLHRRLKTIAKRQQVSLSSIIEAAIRPELGLSYLPPSKPRHNRSQKASRP